MKYEFKTPFEFEGKTYTDIEMDLEALTGADISEVRRLWGRNGGFSPMPTMDYDFCIMVAARAAKLPVEFFKALPAAAYCGIAQEVSAFLIE